MTLRIPDGWTGLAPNTDFPGNAFLAGFSDLNNEWTFSVRRKDGPPNMGPTSEPKTSDWTPCVIAGAPTRASTFGTQIQFHFQHNNHWYVVVLECANGDTSNLAPKAAEFRAMIGSIAWTR